MSSLMSLFSMLIWISVIYTIVKRSKKQRTNKYMNMTKPVDNSRSAAVEQYYKSHPGKDPRHAGSSFNAPVDITPDKQNFMQPPKNSNQRVSTNIKNLKKEFESSNDWLAKEMAEERIKKVMISDMFALKSEHISNCNARDLKNSHVHGKY